MSTIKKLVLPVAGQGRRLRPLTLRRPKALVAVGGRPLLDYIVEEAAESGFSEIFLVASPYHRGHFERYVREARGKFRNLRFTLRLQRKAFGNGQAILAAEGEIGDEPFAVRFCDDLLFHREPVLLSLVNLYEAHRTPLFVVERVPRSRLHHYGVISVKRRISSSLYSVHSVLEKPKGKDIRGFRGVSNLAVVGAYILTPRILSHLRLAAPLAPPLDDALPLTAAFHAELAEGGRIYGWEFPGTRIDCGTLEGLRNAEEFLRRNRR